MSAGVCGCEMKKEKYGVAGCGRFKYAGALITLTAD